MGKGPEWGNRAAERLKRMGYDGFVRGQETVVFDDAQVKYNPPISAAAVDAYGIKLPEGYIREGDRYVFKGEQPSAPATAEAAPAATGEGKPPAKPPEAPPAAVPAPEPSAKRLVWLREEEGIAGPVTVYRVEAPGHPEHGREITADVGIGAERIGALLAEGFKVAGAPAPPAAPRPVSAMQAVVKTAAIESRARRALKEGRRAMRDFGLEGGEEMEHPALAVFDRLFGRGAIYYEPGVSEHGTEIAELKREGLKSLGRFFTRDKARGQPVDQVVEAINRELGGGASTGGGAEDLSISDFLDLLERRELKRAGRVTGDRAQELRRMAEALEDPNPTLARELRAAAEAADSDIARQGREVLRAAAEAPGLREDLRATQIQAAGARAEGLAAGESLRQAEFQARTEAERKAGMAQAAGTLTVRAAEAAGELKLRAAVADARAQLRARRAEAGTKLEENRARFLEAVRRLPPEVRAKMIARGVNLETTGDLANALELADRYLEEHLNRDIGSDLQKAARLIVQHRMEFDPQADAALVREAGRYAEMGREELGGLTLDEIEEISGRLAGAWHEHRTKGLLLTAEGEASAEDAARDIVRDAAKTTPKRIGLEPGPQPRVKRAPWWKRIFREAQFHADTLVEWLMGPEGGRASRMFVDDVGIDAGQTYYRWVNEATDVLEGAARKATGGDMRSERGIRWLTQPVTYDLPHLGRVTAERRYWLKVWQVAGDADALSHLFPVSERASKPGWLWETYRESDKPMDWYPADLEAFKTEFGKDPKQVEFADTLKRFLNRDDWYEAQDSVHYALRGTHIVRVADRAGTSYNWRFEKPQEPPADVAAWNMEVMRRMGRYNPRLAGGRTVSFVVGDAVGDFLREVYEGAAYIGYARPIRNAFTVLGTPLRLAEGRGAVTLEAHLGRHYGRSVTDYLVDHLAHIMGSRRLAPTPLHGLSDGERASLRLIENTTRAAVSWKLGPILNQMPQMFAALADTRPMPPAEWAAATWRVLSDPAAAEAAWKDLARLAPQIRYREELGSVLGLLNPSTYSHTGYSRQRVLREVERFADRGMRGMTWVDKRIRIRDYLAFLRIAEAQGLTGEAAKQQAARETLRMMVRTDVPQDPAYESAIGRLARRNIGAKSLTVFTQGKNALYQMEARALKTYAQDRDARGLLWRLAIIAGPMVGGYAAIGGGVGWLYGGSRRDRSLVGDYVGNALGNIYGAEEAWDLLRARSGYEAEPRHTPVYAALMRAAKGTVDLKRALAESKPEAARRGALTLVRGLSALGGIPTDQVFQIARGLNAWVTPAEKAEKAAAAPARARTFRELVERSRRRRAATARPKTTFRDWWFGKRRAVAAGAAATPLEET